MFWISVVAMAFYALEISITDWKLSSISPKLLTLLYSLGVTIFSFTSLILSRQTFAMPDSKQIIFICLMVLASFIAASAHFHALAIGTGAIKLTMVYMLLPVAATFYMFLFRHDLPNSRLVLSWLLSVAALVVLSTAESKT